VAPRSARILVTRSAEETEALGESLARELGPGDVLALYGDLGAGKTCLVRGLARGLGAAGAVTSPTFTLVHEYPGPLPLYHLDLYRLGSAAELEDLGVEEYLFGAGVAAVEWAEKAGPLLPRRHWDVRFEILDGDERRLAVTPPEKG
jgi:tRNA threonylcarbamoyladenosine biosynthesis protein TsaE